MPHRRPSSPLDDDQAKVDLRRSSSDTSRPQRFLAKLKHGNLTSSNNSSAPPPSALPLPTSSPGASSSSPKVTPLNVSAQMHRLGTTLPQIQVQNTHHSPPSSLSMSNPTAASASSISLASTLTAVNPNATSTATAIPGGGSLPLNLGADRDPWHMLHVHVLPLFNGETLRTSVEDLNELVRKHISNVVARAPARAVMSLEQDVASLLSRGMVTLNVRLAEVDDTKLVSRLVDTWLLFWHRVLPYVEGIFLPFKTEKPMQSLTKMPKSNRPSSPTMPSLSEETTPVTPYPHSHPHTHSINVRTLSLCSFRDSIVYPVYSRLLGVLNSGLGQAQAQGKEKGGEKEKESNMVYQRIQQMLLILLSVSHPPLTSSQSQSSLLTKSPIPLSPQITSSPLSTSTPTPTLASGLGVNTSVGSNTGPGASNGSLGGNSALGIVTTPLSATGSATMPSASTLTADDALSLLLNALRNPTPTGIPTITTSHSHGNKDAQSRTSQPFLMSRNSSFLMGSGPRDRRGRIATRKTNDGRVPALELDLKTKSPLASAGRGQHDQWDDETPRNPGFKHDNNTKSRPDASADPSRNRARWLSDSTLYSHRRDDDGHKVDEGEESYGSDRYESDGDSYIPDAVDSSNSHLASRTPVPGVGVQAGGSGTGFSNEEGSMRRSRRASASEVDGHSSEDNEDRSASTQMRSNVERMVGLR